MAIFRKIHVQFWSDAFIQTLTPEKKFFFLYLLTNERTRQCGIYEITFRQISFDTGYTIDTIEKLLDFFCSAGKVLVSRETNEIAIKNWEKYNGSRSPDVKNLVNKEFTLVKNKKLTEWVQSGYRVVPLSKKSLRGEPEEEPEREPEEEAGKIGSEIGSEVVRNISNEVWKDQIWKEQICIGLKINMDELRAWMALFNSSVSNDNIPGFNKSKYKKIFRGWFLTQKAKGVVLEQDVKRKSESAPLKKLNNGI
jgi:hypothetical protein